MKVWVDQDICTGDGLCTDHCPSMFSMHGELSYVNSTGAGPSLRGGSADMAEIPDHLLDHVLDAAEDCPGECIFIEA